MTFREAVQKGMVPSPTQRRYSEAKWKQGFAEHTNFNKDDQVLRDAGLWMYNKLSDLRTYAKPFYLNALSPYALTTCFIGEANRTYLITRKYVPDLQSAQSITTDQLLSRKIPCGINELHPEQANEAAVETLRLLIQYAQKSSGYHSSPNSAMIHDFGARLNGLKAANNQYYILDELWRAILWCQWRVISYDSYDLLRAPDTHSETLRVAANHRRGRLQLESALHAASFFQFLKPNVPRIEMAGSGKTRRFSVAFNAGTTEYSHYIMQRQCGCEDYLLPYLDVPLPNCPLVTPTVLLDCWQVLAMLSHDMARGLPVPGEGLNFSELRSYCCTLKRPELVKAMARSIKVEKRTAEAALDFLTYNPSNSEQDLFAQPLVLVDRNKVAPVFGSILVANISRCVEHWIKLGGLSITEKGNMYEHYVRQEIKNITQKFSKSFVVRVLNSAVTPKFAPERNVGDVDLVFIFDKTLIIGEIKCFRQPTSYCEIGTTYQLLQQAAKQACEKAKAIEQNLPAFLQMIGWGDITEIPLLKIQPQVITNFPFYTGSTISGVNVIDVVALKCYFEVGGFTGGLYSKSNFLTGSFCSLYDSDQEASANLIQYLKEVPQVAEAVQYVKPMEQHMLFVSGRQLRMRYLEVQPPVVVTSKFEAGSWP